MRVLLGGDALHHAARIAPGAPPLNQATFVSREFLKLASENSKQSMPFFLTPHEAFPLGGWICSNRTMQQSLTAWNIHPQRGENSDITF